MNTTSSGLLCNCYDDLTMSVVVNSQKGVKFSLDLLNG
jgi:hypothetical protein